MGYGNRHSVRRPGQDYSGPGLYFITLCTADRECLFGKIRNGKMYLNDLGRIVDEEWIRSPEVRSELQMDQWQVMPDHFHGIVRIRPYHTQPLGCCRGDRPVALKGRSLGSFVGGFKAITTKRINELRGRPGKPVWQRNYDEHIIDNDQEWDRVRRYIEDNPINSIDYGD
jgi:putative transposase